MYERILFNEKQHCIVSLHPQCSVFWPKWCDEVTLDIINEYIPWDFDDTIFQVESSPYGTCQMATVP